MKNNNKGVALITTLALGLVALVFISAFLYIILNSTKTSGQMKTYTSALEVAKGTASYLMNIVLEPNWDSLLKCDSSSPNCEDCVKNNNCGPCSLNYKECKLDVSDLQNEVSGYSIDAYILDIKEYGTNKKIFTFKVISQKNNSSEKAEIDFIYKVEPR